VGKMKFHHFGPPLEKILPTPMLVHVLASVTKQPNAFNKYIHIHQTVAS